MVWPYDAYIFAPQGTPPPPPHGTLYWYADISGSISSGATLAGGTELAAWGTATTAVGTPLTCMDSVTGDRCVRTRADNKLQTAAGAAGFMSLAASSMVLVWRSRKINSGTTFPIFDTTENGTVPGFQLRAYNNDTDFFATRQIGLRIFDGATWILDTDVTSPGVFIPLKWHVVSVRVSGTQWDIRVDGKSTHFTVQTISLTFPGTAPGKAEIGQGAQDYQAIELYDSYLSDIAVAAAETRLASRFASDLIIPINGLINVVTPLDPQYTAFPWATVLPSGDIDVTCFNGMTESPASNTFITEQMSVDGGQTWPTPTTIFSSTLTVSEAGAWTLVMSNGHVLRIGYTWDIASGLGKVIWAQVSADGGLTYPTRVDVTIGTPDLVQLGGAPVEDPDNAGHVFFAVFQGAAAGPWDSVMYKSLNFGSTWAATTIANGTVDARSYSEPQLLFHSSGELRCLIRDYTSGNGSGMCMTKSDDKGATWAAVTAKLIDATSAGQSYLELASGREPWLGRVINNLLLALYQRPPGSVWDADWAEVPPFNTSVNSALYIDPRPGEMVYGTILELSPGVMYLVWGTFTGSNPNTIADVVGRRNFYEWYLTQAMPGIATPATATGVAAATQQIHVTGAGDFTFAITDNQTGGSVDSAGLYTYGSTPGTDTVAVTDLNSKIVDTCAFTVSGGGGSVTVTSILPDSGYPAGGDSVTITGTGFTGATGATIGGVSITSFAVVNSTTITGVTGVHVAADLRDVVVTNGSTGTLTGGFTYLPAGTTLDLDADTLALSNGASVGAWPDRSGNANDAAPLSFAPTFATSGINGKRAVIFIAAEDMSFASFTSGLTGLELFIVCQNDDDGATTGSPFSFTDDTVGNLFPNSANRMLADDTGSDALQVTGFVPATGVWALPWLYSVVGTASEWTARFNGVEIYTVTPNTFGYGTKHVGKGVTQPYAGKIGRLLMWPSKLSAPNHAIVEAYLLRKYGVV